MTRILMFVTWLAALAFGLLVAILGWAGVAFIFWMVWTALNGSPPTP
jgi:threonine/homoserine/homoserine lactone efflux protein